LAAPLFLLQTGQIRINFIHRPIRLGVGDVHGFAFVVGVNEDRVSVGLLFISPLHHLSINGPIQTKEFAIEVFVKLFVLIAIGKAPMDERNFVVLEKDEGIRDRVRAVEIHAAGLHAQVFVAPAGGVGESRKSRNH
jgi:hypothetical protein